MNEKETMPSAGITLGGVFEALGQIAEQDQELQRQIAEQEEEFRQEFLDSAAVAAMAGVWPIPSPATAYDAAEQLWAERMKRIVKRRAEAQVTRAGDPSIEIHEPSDPLVTFVCRSGRWFKKTKLEGSVAMADTGLAYGDRFRFVDGEMVRADG